MVHVKVRIFHRAAPGKIELELEDGNSVETLLMQIKEKAEPEQNMMAFLSNPDSLIILLNGMSIFSVDGWQTMLREGDEVSLLPMVAGG